MNLDNSQNTLAVIYDLRKPLDHIQLAAEMLRPCTFNEDKEVYLDVILRSTRRIENLVKPYFVQRQQ